VKLTTYEELLVSYVVQQEGLTRLLVEKEIFTKEELLGMVGVIDQERERKKG
jgi:hypothetical protein